MIDVVLSPEASAYREQLRNGGMLPASAPAEVDQPRQIKKTKSSVRRPESVGRFKTMNAFIDRSARLVDTTAQAAWFVLFREVKPNGIAQISQRQVADRIGVSRRTAIRAIQQLEQARLVTAVSRGGLSGEMTAYEVHGEPVNA